MNTPNRIFVTISSQPLLTYTEKDNDGNITASVTVTQFTIDPAPYGFARLSGNIAPSLKITGPNPIEQLTLEQLQEIVTTISDNDDDIERSHVFSTENCIYSVDKEPANLSGGFTNPVPLFQLASRELRIRAYEREYSYTFPSSDPSSAMEWGILGSQSYIALDIVT